MKSIGFQTAEDLSEYLTTLGPGYLFRGQLREYYDLEGRPSLSTTFHREGCVPPLMLKWFYYSNVVLQRCVEGFDNRPDLAIDEAVLQHYGFRSFFIDATSKPEVACWFAGHKYTTDRSINLTEDCWEDPAWLVHQWAKYEPQEGTGVVYVFSRKAIRAAGIQAVNLEEITPKRATARYAKQFAWMVGPLESVLPADCIATRIYAPTSVFREVAATHCILSQSELFPPPKDDPILDALLSLPFIHREFENDPPPLEVFDRSLPLPEYGWKPLKRHPPTIAFYSRFWSANETGRMRLKDCAAFILSDEALFFGKNAHENLCCPNILRLLVKHRTVAIETNNAIAFPGFNQFCSYGKGVYLALTDDNIVSVHEIVLEQTGRRPSHIGPARGWSYRVEGERWVRVVGEEDCPCGDNAVHLRHLTFLAHVEEEFRSGHFSKVRAGVYCGKGLDPTLNLSKVEIDDDDQRVA